MQIGLTIASVNDARDLLDLLDALEVSGPKQTKMDAEFLSVNQPPNTAVDASQFVGRDAIAVSQVLVSKTNAER